MRAEWDKWLNEKTGNENQSLVQQVTTAYDDVDEEDAEYVFSLDKTVTVLERGNEYRVKVGDNIYDTFDKAREEENIVETDGGVIETEYDRGRLALGELGESGQKLYESMKEQGKVE